MKITIKEKVQQLMESYNTQLKEIQDKITAWKKDPIYSDAHKRERIAELQQKADQLDAEYNSKLKGIVTDEKEAFVGDPKTKPADYQIQISNALKFLELEGKNLSDDRASIILKPFQDDFETLVLFNSVITDQLSGNGVMLNAKKTLKILGKAKQYETIMKDFQDIEFSAYNYFSHSKANGLHEYTKKYMLMDKLSEIDQLTNAFDAAA